MNSIDYKTELKKQGLKVTPQRLAVLEAVNALHDHPTADEVISFIRKMYPNVATGTVYKTLETLVGKGIITRIKTDRDIMRYDGVTELHHHLYCKDSGQIKDYSDDELNRILKNYFKKNKIKRFKIEEINLQITGRFKDKSKKEVEL